MPSDRASEECLQRLLAPAFQRRFAKPACYSLWIALNPGWTVLCLAAPPFLGYTFDEFPVGAGSGDRIVTAENADKFSKASGNQWPAIRLAACL
jgi:hypothetical protein